MQDYKLVVRGLVGGASVVVNGLVTLQNFSEFMTMLNEQYLSRGYKVLNAENLRIIPADEKLGTPLIYEFAYHLVKEVKE